MEIDSAPLWVSLPPPFEGWKTRQGKTAMTTTELARAEHTEKVPKAAVQETASARARTIQTSSLMTPVRDPKSRRVKRAPASANKSPGAAAAVEEAAAADEPTLDDDAADGTPTAAADQAVARAVLGSLHEIAHRTAHTRHTVRTEGMTVDNYLRIASKEVQIALKAVDTAAGLRRAAPIRRTAGAGDMPAGKYAPIALYTADAQAEIVHTAAEPSRTELQADRSRNRADTPTLARSENSPENRCAKIPDKADLPRAFLARTLSNRRTLQDHKHANARLIGSERVRVLKFSIGDAKIV